MNRAAWIAAILVALVPATTFAQMGGMGGGMGGGGMGGGGMGGRMMGGFASVEIRRSVRAEMEGGRQLSGQINLGTLIVHGDLGTFWIQPDKVKMIRFLKPAAQPKAEDDAQAQVQGGGNNGQAVMMLRRVNQNNGMNTPNVRAKVILSSGEEVIGDIQVTTGFRLDVDYGTIVPALDKLRTMTFAEVAPKTATAEAGAATDGPSPRPRDTPAAAPEYVRHAQAVVVRSSADNQLALYDMATKQSIELAGPKDAPLEITPVYGQGLMALGLRGTNITRIAVADTPGGWHVQELRQPTSGRVIPVVGQGTAIFIVGRYAYAYGTGAHRWDVAELPEGLRAAPEFGPNTATIEGRGHIYTFDGRTGKWDHVDTRAVLDVARARTK